MKYILDHDDNSVASNAGNLSDNTDIDMTSPSPNMTSGEASSQLPDSGDKTESNVDADSHSE